MPFRFPIFTMRSNGTCVPNPLMPQYVLAFSSAEKATTYMQRRGENWEFKMVNRFNVGPFADDLRKQGLSGICYDPDSDGKLGEQVSIQDLVE